jgi:hypothetical protein
VRILIDECVNSRLRKAFPEHEVVAVVTTAWRQVRDHRLVDANQGKFDVLVTIDRGFEFQHNLSKLSFGIVIAMRERIGKCGRAQKHLPNPSASVHPRTISRRTPRRSISISTSRIGGRA